MRFFVALAATVALASPVMAQTSTNGMSGKPTTMPTCADGMAVLWLDATSKIYYTKKSTSFGKTKHGRFVCRRTKTTMGERGATSGAMKMDGGQHGPGAATGHATSATGHMAPHSMSGDPKPSAHPDLGQHGPGGAVTAPSPGVDATTAPASPSGVAPSNMPDRGQHGPPNIPAATTSPH